MLSVCSNSFSFSSDQNNGKKTIFPHLDFQKNRNKNTRIFKDGAQKFLYIWVIPIKLLLDTSLLINVLCCFLDFTHSELLKIPYSYGDNFGFAIMISIHSIILSFIENVYFGYFTGDIASQMIIRRLTSHKQPPTKPMCCKRTHGGCQVEPWGSLAGGVQLLSLTLKGGSQGYKSKECGK